MSKTSEWIKQHPNGLTFKCDCGATVNLKAWLEDMGKNFTVLHLHARCWKCNKELDQYKETMLIDLAMCDVISAIIDEFQRNFNRGAKEKIIHVVK